MLLPSPISHTKRPSRATRLEKKLAAEVEELQSAYPEAEIQLWCEDEHRLELKPIERREQVLREKHQLPTLIGDLNGYGCMHSYIP